MLWLYLKIMIPTVYKKLKFSWTSIFFFNDIVLSLHNLLLQCGQFNFFSTLIHAFVVYSTASSTNYQSVDFLPRRSIFSSVAFDILISLRTFPFILYWWGNSSGEWLSSKRPKNSDEYRFSDTLYQAQRYFTLSFLRFLGCGKVFRIWIT